MHKGPDLREDELGNTGVGKILLSENQKLTKEIVALKKSLKRNQDELEKLRSENHELDKQNTVLGFKLNTAIVPELLKFIASTFAGGLAISLLFAQQFVLGGFVLFIAIGIYIAILIQSNTNKT